MFRPLRFAVLLAGVTLAFSAWAQPAPDDDGPGGPAADPPTRVARLSYLHGDVSFVPAGENDWVEAQLNRPLITGDKLWTDRGGRAELGIGPATLRIDQNTSFDFLNLDDKVAQVELTQGSLNLHIRRLYDEQTYEIDTPTLAFVVNRVGDFRIDVLPNGQSTVVTVLQGGGDAYGEGGARFRIEEGQSVTFNDPQLQQYDIASIPQRDDFDDFYAQRDHRWDSSASRRYVSEDVVGYEDLDDNGEWSDEPEYGNVWYPTTVAVGWSPYHHGHWGWVGAYGWTWIDDAPWGYAPFHYGRWAYVHNRWGWCPGPVGVRAVYAPALVAFVGGGVSIGIHSGPVGWFPLGPRDVYFPSYRVSEHYFTRLNGSNTRVINNVTINNYYGNYRRGNVDFERINYSNRHVNGAVVAVSHETFVGARPVGREAIAVNERTFANGGRVSGFAAVAPTRTSLVASTATARVAPPAQVMNRQIVAASKPPAPVASFAQRENQLTKNPGRPLPVTQLRTPVAAPAAAGSPAALNAGRGNANGNGNVRVVTNNGAPVRAAAPVLPVRGNGIAPVAGTPNAGAANNGAPNTRVAPNAAVNTRVAPNATAGRDNPAAQPGRNNGLPAVQNNNTGPAATGRPAAGSRLDSSRFAHPQNGAAQTGAQTGQNSAPQNNSLGQPSRVSGSQIQPVQRVNPATNSGPAATGSPSQNNNRYSAPERGGLNAGGQQQPQATQSPKPTASPYNGRNVGGDRTGNNGGDNGRAASNAREYHAPVQQQQQQYHPQPQTQRESVQPVQRVQPQPQVQREPQQQYHAPTPQPQQQYRAPVQQQQPQQMQMQRQQPPPQQVQRVQPQPQVNRAPPQEKGKDKKDDDKRH